MLTCTSLGFLLLSAYHSVLLRQALPKCFFWLTVVILFSAVLLLPPLSLATIGHIHSIFISIFPSNHYSVFCDGGSGGDEGDTVLKTSIWPTRNIVVIFYFFDKYTPCYLTSQIWYCLQKHTESLLKSTWTYCTRNLESVTPGLKCFYWAWFPWSSCFCFLFFMHIFCEWDEH